MLPVLQFMQAVLTVPRTLQFNRAIAPQTLLRTFTRFSLYIVSDFKILLYNSCTVINVKRNISLSEEKHLFCSDYHELQGTSQYAVPSNQYQDYQQQSNTAYGTYNSTYSQQPTQMFVPSNTTPVISQVCMIVNHFEYLV